MKKHRHENARVTLTDNLLTRRQRLFTSPDPYKFCTSKNFSSANVNIFERMIVNDVVFPGGWMLDFTFWFWKAKTDI